VAVEYDGRVHAEDAVQFAKDADRWDRIRDQGWQHVRILNHHMRDSGEPAVRKVAEALIRAGWRPQR
jgi:very-short-patch-repair endonuclease